MAAYFATSRYLTHEVFKEFESFFLFMDPNMIFMIRFSEGIEDSIIPLLLTIIEFRCGRLAHVLGAT